RTEEGTGREEARGPPLTFADPATVGGAMALSAAALWAISTVVYKGAIVRFGPRAMNLFRCTVALVLFWITTLLVDGPRFLVDFATRDGVILVASGMLGLGIGDHFLFHSMRRIGAQPAIALNQLTPIWSALIGVLLASEVLSSMQYAAMAI